MLKKIILIFFFLFILIKPLYASIEDKIIKNLIKTDNLTFNFKQTINEKTEEGKYIPKMLGVIEGPVNKMMKAYPDKFSFMRHKTTRSLRPSKTTKVTKGS